LLLIEAPILQQNVAMSVTPIQRYMDTEEERLRLAIPGRRRGQLTEFPAVEAESGKLRLDSQDGTAGSVPQMMRG
jgi:hypothetical protein